MKKYNERETEFDMTIYPSIINMEWNGKIYSNNIIYLNDEKKQLNQEDVESIFDITLDNISKQKLTQTRIAEDEINYEIWDAIYDEIISKYTYEMVIDGLENWNNLFEYCKLYVFQNMWKIYVKKTIKYNG